MKQVKKIINHQLFLFLLLIFSLLLMFSKLKPLYVTREIYSDQKQIIEKNEKKLKELRAADEKIFSSENKEKYFREQYKISKKGEILFSFPVEN